MANVTMNQIQFLTGHESADAVRMALKRAGIKASGIAMGTGVWPPKKIYEAVEVWQLFGARILERAAENAEVKERCWSVFRDQIVAAANGATAASVFSDRLS